MRWLAVTALAACNFTPAPEAVTVDAGAPALLAPAQDPWAEAGWQRRPALPASGDSLGILAVFAPKKPYAQPAAPPPPVERLTGAAPEVATDHAIVAAPAAAMRALAVSADGKVAVSSDSQGSVRLWPSLDGTREPVVVAMRRPVALAVMHDEQELVIAGIDGAGQLELARTSVFGALASSGSVDLPRPAIAVFAVPAGFVVERDDQKLVFVWPSGAVGDQAEPPPGVHIAAIAVQDDVMLALLDGGDVTYAQRIGIAGGLTWGDKTVALPIKPRAIALAPNHEQIAAVVETATSTRLAVVDLATGKIIAETADNQFLDPAVAPVGFIDGTTVVMRSAGNQLSLWHTDSPTDLESLNDERQAPTAAIGRRQAVLGLGAELMLVDGAGATRYLGFRMPSLATVIGGAHSLLATDGQRLLRIGADLRLRVAYNWSPGDASDATPTLLDSNHVLVQRYADGKPTLSILALDSLDEVPLAEQANLLAYDPSSRIAAFAAGDKLELRRFDPTTATFGRAAETTVGTSESVTFGATTAAGTMATVVTYDSDSSRTITLVAQPERARLKVLEVTKHALQETEEGTLVPADPPPPVFVLTRKSPDGALTATMTAGRITLREADGTVRWSVPYRGVSSVVWLGPDELLGFGGGLARIDLATGAIEDRRCGWEFGLWETPLETFGSSRICEAE